MNIQHINKNDQMADMPDTYNKNLDEINKAIDHIMAEIQRLNDEVFHLKILTRE